jgi:hypothetical protein
MKTVTPHVSSPIGRQRTQVGVLCLLVLTLVASVEGRDPVKVYPLLTLKDGRQFTAVEVVKCTPHRVLVRHRGGATSLHTELLPEQVIAELRLTRPPLARSLADEPALLPLAGKVAVAAPADSPIPDFAHKAAVTEPSETDSLALAHRVAVAPAGPASPGTDPRETKVDRRGEVDRGSCAGWVAVTPPSGATHLLANVEIAAYPAELLAQALRQAGANSGELTRQLRDQAVVAQQEGRVAASAALLARAAKTAAVFIASLPATPYTTRSDASGRFALRQDGRDLRLVAVARVPVAQGECTYVWIGVRPGLDCLLTEANATIVSTPPASDSRLAVR